MSDANQLHAAEAYVYLPGATVFELEHLAILHAVARHGGSNTKAALELGLSRSTVIKHVNDAAKAPPVADAHPLPPPGTDDDTWLYLPGKTIEQIETEAIERATRRHGGSNTKAATELGISRSTVIKRMSELLAVAKRP